VFLRRFLPPFQRREATRLREDGSPILILRGLDDLFNLLLSLAGILFTESVTWHHNISLIFRVEQGCSVGSDLPEAEVAGQFLVAQKKSLPPTFTHTRVLC